MEEVKTLIQQHNEAVNKNKQHEPKKYNRHKSKKYHDLIFEIKNINKQLNDVLEKYT